MLSNSKKLIAVIGATGHQGGAVVRALQAGGQFKVRALTRNPDKHRDLADEVVEADLNRPETLAAAFKGAYGVFLVTTSSLEGTDERKQGAAAVQAAKDAGVKHVVWSTLPDVEAISGGKFHVPHFTSKAKVDSSDQRRQVPRSALYQQGEGRFDSQGRGVCESYVRHRAVLLPEPRRRHGSATAGRRIHGLGAPARSECALHSHG